MPPTNRRSQATQRQPLLPVLQSPPVIGVFGSGQLGRMLAFEARRMGYHLHTFSPEQDSPTGQIADREVVAAYDDPDAVAAFVRDVDVVTFEFENVPVRVAEIAATEGVPVRPGGQVLHTAQNRLREKTALRQAGLPVTPHRAVASLAELESALTALGTPAILKTAAFGYDGKGQVRINAAEQAPSAWQELGRQPCVLEAFVAFEREVSVVAARGLDGSFAAFPLVENRHANHILDVTIAPAAVPAHIATEARELTRRLLDALDVVGVLCVEFFLLPAEQDVGPSDPTIALPSVTHSGRLLINEIAPRPHNSGHWTIEGAVTSQFEQQLRAVCGLPLGSTEQLGPTVMLNLLGDLWQQGEPDWSRLLAFPGVQLHLYGKAEARPGRKMGHLTVTAGSGEEALETGVAARAALWSSLENRVSNIRSRS